MTQGDLTSLGLKSGDNPGNRRRCAGGAFFPTGGDLWAGGQQSPGIVGKTRIRGLLPDFQQISFLSVRKDGPAGRSGEMADAPDSKSGMGKTMCGFESHLRYFLIRVSISSAMFPSCLQFRIRLMVRLQ